MGLDALEGHPLAQVLRLRSRDETAKGSTQDDKVGVEASGPAFLIGRLRLFRTKFALV